MGAKTAKKKSKKSDGSKKADAKKADAEKISFAEALRCPPGPVDLSELDPRATFGAIGDKTATREAMPELGLRLEDLQERLYANAQAAGDQRRVLLVLQGMDTSGKGGVVKHVVGPLNPYGSTIKSFKSPTKEELSHDFLWRIRNALPKPGYLGVFDRSHYEDVLIARVRELVPRRVWSRRYATINRFEERLAADGCTIVKCFLHISPETQQERLMARLDDPGKHWKYNPSDVDERMLWPAYQEAYAAALDKCNTEAAPWYVIPSDRKWYRNYAIMMLLTEVFEGLGLEWPKGDFDLATEKARVAGS
ncbi:polyphosphate kinase 2 family protein [Actinomadura barringtoniae]|uniref:Polyphosphate kinase 2 family protein n=1 Tax=Actinomadura barringtoniae TaxID=1427535 RepID=A0A939T4E0_9ACTN|nr:PPK2 family polyphosphate kinase [Actinomadura barringtoniae]MBO2452451.1 polyphosphate kinase 2 family protein [Actinomadura barringtoniae]